MTPWMPEVDHVPTAAFGYTNVPVGSMRPVAVVSHIMQGYQSTMVQWAKERPPSAQKSAHFTIGRSGKIVQHVGIFDPAWHAGIIREPSWALIRPGSNPNLYTVGIEHEGFSVDPGYAYDYLYSDAKPWPQEMVEASIRVHRWILAETGILPSIDSVIGHRNIDGVTRANDPGMAWPQARIIAALKPPVRLTTDQQSLLDWLATAAGQRLDLSTRNRLLTEAGLSTDAAPAPTAPTPPQPAPVPPQPSSTNEAALRAIADIKRATAALEAALEG